VVLAALFVASGLLFAFGGGTDPAEAACMDPVVEIRPRAAGPGDAVTISGYGWRQGCNDTVDCPDGGPCPTDASAPPRTGIRLRFSQGRNNDTLGVADADQNGRFTHQATIPLWAEKGAASVMADGVVTGFAVTAPGGLDIVPVRLGDPTATPPAASAGGLGQGLAKTGTEVAYLIAIGLLFIATGSTLRRLSLA